MSNATQNQDRFCEVIAQLARKYFGPVNHKLSKPGVELRFGNHGSKSVDLGTALWFDHELKIGGGVVDLIRHHEPNANVAEILAQFGLPQDFNRKRQETRFDYCDENGEVRYQVVRIDMIDNGIASKTFRQGRIDPDTGKFTWGMIGVDALLYRLPELLGADLATPIFIVEGEKCADALARHNFVVTTNHGGAGNWHQSLSAWFENRDVIILPDNDLAGEKHAHKVANALRVIAKTVSFMYLPDLCPKGDVADWLESGKTRDDFEVLLNDLKPIDWDEFDQDEIDFPLFDSPNEKDSEPSSRIKLTAWRDLRDKEVKWLVKDLIPANSFVALFGKPGSYKSFVALYMATMIALGRDAFEKETEKGHVVYIAGEGAAGLKARCDALMRKYDLSSSIDVHFVDAQINLRSTDADRIALTSVIQKNRIKPALIIIDTLARAFGGGNENTSEDMGAFIRHVGHLQAELNTAVMIVHHSGKDEARGQRGHSSLLGAVDAELEVVKIGDSADGSRTGKLTVTKQKDGEDGIEVGYALEVANLSILGFGDRTSLAVIPGGSDIHSRVTSKPLSPKTRAILQALEKAIKDYGEVRHLSNIPSDRLSVTKSLWRETYYMMSGQEQGTKQRAFVRASETLIQSRTIGYWSEYCWLPDSYTNAGQAGHGRTDSRTTKRPTQTDTDTTLLGVRLSGSQNHFNEMEL